MKRTGVQSGNVTKRSSGEEHVPVTVETLARKKEVVDATSTVCAKDVKDAVRPQEQRNVFRSSRLHFSICPNASSFADEPP